MVIPDYIGQDGLRRPIRHANEFWDSYGIAVHDGLQRGGDLIFFSRTGRMPTHIGIMVDEETYIHSPGQDNMQVEISTVNRAAIMNDGMESVIYSRNPIGFKSPAQPIAQPTYRYHQATA